MVYYSDRVPQNGHGETMAVSHDEADAAVSAYEKGVTDGLRTAHAQEDREGRYWRVAFLLATAAAIWGLFAIAAALTTLANVASIK